MGQRLASENLERLLGPQRRRAREAVIRRYGGQRILFEAALGPVEPFIDPMFWRFDLVLTVQCLVDTVFQRQTHRRPHSRDRARPGTPADIILRLLILQRLRGWTFDETEREVRASLVYRWVSHIYLGPVPDVKTLSAILR